MADGISATATIVKKSAIALKFLGVALLLYIGGVAIYAYSQFSSTKTKLLTYGLSDATGNLLAYTVMLVALALPVDGGRALLHRYAAPQGLSRCDGAAAGVLGHGPIACQLRCDDRRGAQVLREAAQRRIVLS